MRTILKITAISLLFLILPMITFAQSPPHPNGGSGPGIGNTPVGGSAPLSGSLIILLSLAAGYGTEKVYQIRMDNKILE